MGRNSVFGVGKQPPIDDPNPLHILRCSSSETQKRARAFPSCPIENGEVGGEGVAAADEGEGVAAADADDGDGELGQVAHAGQQQHGGGKKEAAAEEGRSTSPASKPSRRT